MNIGIPYERKTLEGRVALTPSAVHQLSQRGHRVYVEIGAGLKSGYSDRDYIEAGAHISPDAKMLYHAAELIVKVKEPIADDLQHLNPRHTLFCFLHLAANPELTSALRKIGLTAIAFETIEVDGKLPLLAPMSEIAGKVAVQAGAHLLHQHKGLLLGGVQGTEVGKVTIIGAGNAGRAALEAALALGADVQVFDINTKLLAKLKRQYPRLHADLPHRLSIQNAVCGSDLLIGAVLVTGARAPVLVDRRSIQQMAKGSIVIDIAIDQGGCIDTIQPTDYSAPTYDYHGVIHMGVTNMPGAVPRTASQALSGAITPYVAMLAEHIDNEALDGGINVRAGKIIHPALLAA